MSEPAPGRKKRRREGGRGDFVFELTGGRLCLDFANTVDNRPSVRRKELLNRYSDLVRWSRQAGALSDREGRSLLRDAARRPADAQSVLRRAIALREAIYEIFRALAARRSPTPADLDRVNAVLPKALARLRVARSGPGFAWKWRSRPQALEAMLWPVARSAADLLTSSDLGSVRECAADTCGWLFLDRSRNRSRRWCDMKVCGNRSKARRFYARRRVGL